MMHAPKSDVQPTKQFSIIYTRLIKHPYVFVINIEW